jgi:hypothetical protein
MLTADQLSAICAKYGAVNHEALQEAARMAVLYAASTFNHPDTYWIGRFLSKLAEIDPSDQDALLRIIVEPHTPPAHPRSLP